MTYGVPSEQSAFEAAVPVGSSGAQQREDEEWLRSIESTHREIKSHERRKNAQSLTPGARALLDRLQPIHEVTPDTQPNYLVKGLIDKGAISGFVGPSNVGKTVLATDIVMHVAAGKDWNGHRVAKPAGSVVYVAVEGERGMLNRIEANRLNSPDLVANAKFYLLFAQVDLRNPGHMQDLTGVLRHLGASAVVLDTFARSFSGDENSAQDVGAVIRNLDKMRNEIGCHVMLVHHSGKDPDRGARGSSALKAALDTEIKITREDDVITATATKQRDMECGFTFSYKIKGIEIGTDCDGDPITSAVLVPTEPVTPRPKLSPQQMIAMRALDDALAHHGEKRHGDMYPPNRNCVSLETWKQYCQRHHLTEGDDSSAFRQAFGRAWKALQEKGLVGVIDGFAWRVSHDD